MPTKTPELLGDYSPPEIERGDWLFCLLRGKVQVGGYTDAPIPWPRLFKGGKPVHILCGDLVEAIRTESAQAVAYWWGVHPHTVTKWRRALAVERNTPGSRKLHQKLFDKRIPDEAKKRGLEALHTPKVKAKAASQKKKQPVSQNSLKALEKSRHKPKSNAWKAKHAERMRKEWAEGKRHHPQAWTNHEIDLLGTDTDEVVSAMIGRTVDAVAVKRRQLKIKPIGKRS